MDFTERNFLARVIRKFASLSLGSLEKLEVASRE